MKALLRSRLSSGWTFFANRPSALERAVRPSPKSRRLRMEPLENRALLAVDAFVGAASLIDSDVGESWGPDPAPAFSASELSTDAADTTISLAALNAVPYGPYVNSEQAALIALRSNATLADETLGDFGALWDETAETTLAETETDVETLCVVAETLAFESFDLGEVEQEPLPGDASVMSGSTGNSGGGDITVATSGGTSAVSGGLSFATDGAIAEGDGIILNFYGGSELANTTISAVVAGVDSTDFSTCETFILLNAQGYGSLTFQTTLDGLYEGNEVATITLSASGNKSFTQNSFTLTIVDDPEFISPDDAATNSTVVNTDSWEYVFSTSDTGIGKVKTLYTPQIHSAYDTLVYSHQRAPNTDHASAALTVSNAGVVTYKAQTAAQKCGDIVVNLTALYDPQTPFSDVITLHYR